jgi:hypothetical protein
MPGSPIREPERIRQDATRKLREVQIGNHSQTNPRLPPLRKTAHASTHEMSITSDGHLLGRCEGEAMFKAFLWANRKTVCEISRELSR